MRRRMSGPESYKGPSKPLDPLEITISGQTLRLISTTTVFGTAVDIGPPELPVGSFFAADPEMAQARLGLAADR